MHRLTVRYEGRVQGVGFRATVLDIARDANSAGAGLSGQIRNMYDGSVELIAEGDESQLVRFSLAIRTRLSRNIVQHREEWSTIEERSFSDFSIAPSR